MKMKLYDEVLDEVKKILGSEYVVERAEVAKNNNVTRSACMIRKINENVAPLIYWDGFLEQLSMGLCSSMDVAGKIVHMYREREKEGEEIYGSVTMNKEYILKNVVYSVINAGWNQEYLSDKVYERFLDLAVIYKLVVVRTDDGWGIITITESICEQYDIDVEELKKAARENTEGEGFYIRPLKQCLEELQPQGIMKVDTEDNLLWVCMTEYKMYGAAVILYKECLTWLAERLGNDLYILPSSIHEILVMSVGIVPEGVSLGNLKGMVAEINSKEVYEDEVLSNSVYYYSRQTGEVTIV